MNPLETKNIYEKIRITQKILIEYQAKNSFIKMTVPEKLGRDVEIKPPKQHPDKKGLSHLIGKQRLLHDLASIELQAMELGVRTLIEFQKDESLPIKFLEELAQITYEESLHCRACLDLLEQLGGEWGMFPVHLGLWNVARSHDSILERLLKVHRYLEGSGLDATTTLANRLKTIPGASKVYELILKISADEMGHVQFGSRWFAYFCEQNNLSRISECKRILKQSVYELPYRREPIKKTLRIEAGFLEEEVQAFQDFQKELCI